MCEVLTSRVNSASLRDLVAKDLTIGKQEGS